MRVHLTLMVTEWGTKGRLTPTPTGSFLQLSYPPEAWVLILKLGVGSAKAAWPVMVGTSDPQGPVQALPG